MMRNIGTMTAHVARTAAATATAGCSPFVIPYGMAIRSSTTGASERSATWMSRCRTSSTIRHGSGSQAGDAGLSLGAAGVGLVPQPASLWGRGNERGHRGGMARVVEVHHREERGAGVMPFPRPRLLPVHLHVDLHRRAADVREERGDIRDLPD